tara:strand:- start:437 stop:580 length:144 start_codon:yes stop_codon:yes gene_type:complete
VDPFIINDIVSEERRNIIAIEGADIKKIIPKLKNVCPICNRSILFFI